MAHLLSRFDLAMPSWFNAFAAGLPDRVKTTEEGMAIIIDLSRLNIEHDTGGPFAAGVFETGTGRIISLGVNRVMAHRCSSAHAEIMAISLAQQQLGTYDLGGKGLPRHELVVNWLPCTMCFGAVLWSGVKRLVIAGHGAELEEITGFDEGPRPVEWREELDRRGIDTVADVMRDRAVEVFREFRDKGRTVYNPRQDC